MKSIAPMLATIGKEIPRGDGWVFEPKYDGIRILAYVNGRDVALVTRNGLDKTRQFPEIADSLCALEQRAKRPFVLDGEIVAMHGDTPARFQELQGRMHVTDRMAIAHHREESPASLVAFDLLLDGKKTLVTEPWRVRRKHLAALLQPPGRTSALRLSDVGENGEAMLRTARRNDWEGIIAKRDDAPYQPGKRSRDWLKLKIERRQEFVVGGWTEPRNTREHIGAILLGYYDTNGDLIYAGHTGAGFTRKSLLEMYQQLTTLERKSSPFTTTPKTNEHPHWARPSIVVEIKFNEWTADGKLRQPVFLGVRDDKSPREVRHEPESMARGAGRGRRGAKKAGAVRKRTTTRGASATAKKSVRRAKPATRKPQPAARAPRPASRLIDQLTAIEGSGGSGAVELPEGSLEVSNLDKVFFPETKQTKGDLMRYYVRVAPFILPAIADRPLVMKRFPNGVDAKGFFQQRAPAEAPDIVRVEPVSDLGLRTQDRLIGGDLPTLLYVVQLGAISIDPWHSRVQSVTHADYSIIDLDPGPRAPFARVVEVAHAVKDVLDEMQLHAVPKTSGASGLHIVLPLGPDVPNDGARMLAELVATLVAERNAKIATVERSVNARPSGAVYVDYLQNIRAKTVAGVYSVRAQPHATVSTPLRWNEVNESLDPREFTMDTVPPRVAKLGDLWARGMKAPNSLAGMLNRG